MSNAGEEPETVEPREFTPCPICSRKFLPDRLSRHIEICEKQRKKQRQIFDSSKQRAPRDEKGDLIMTSGLNTPLSPKKTNNNNSKDKTNDTDTENNGKTNKSNWRIAHEEFIKTVRRARGEIIEDKEDDNIIKKIPPGYVQCSCCGRNFSKAAAERHIPWCKEQKSRPPRSPVSGDALNRFKARAKYKAPNLKKNSTENSDEKKNGIEKQSRSKKAQDTLNKDNGKTRNNDEVVDNKVMIKKTNKKEIKPLERNYKQIISDNRKLDTRHRSPIRKENYTTSKVKLRIQENKAKQHPKTPVMKFKEKFPNHTTSDESITSKMLQNNESLKEMLKRPDGNFSSSIIPKTVPGVRTRGLSPIRTNEASTTENLKKDNFDKMKAKIDEIYYGRGYSERVDNGTRSSGSESSRPSLSRSSSTEALPRFCHQCGTKYPSFGAKYCYECGARRLGASSSLLGI